MSTASEQDSIRTDTLLSGTLHLPICECPMHFDKPAESVVPLGADAFKNDHLSFHIGCGMAAQVYSAVDVLPGSRNPSHVSPNYKENTRSSALTLGSFKAPFGLASDCPCKHCGASLFTPTGDETTKSVSFCHVEGAMQGFCGDLACLETAKALSQITQHPSRTRVQADVPRCTRL